MNKIYEEAFKTTIGHEGGFTKDPFDNGNWTGGFRNKGELRGTKFGISAGAYPELDIENLTLEQAKQIYYLDYWKRLKCDSFNANIATELFDTGVNAGVGMTAKLFQKALNYTNRNTKDYPDIKVDGGIGPVTISAYNANRYKYILFNVMNILQGAFYLELMQKNKGYEKYIGWFNRVEIIKK